MNLEKHFDVVRRNIKGAVVVVTESIASIAGFTQVESTPEQLAVNIRKDLENVENSLPKMTEEQKNKFYQIGVKVPEGRMHDTYKYDIAERDLFLAIERTILRIEKYLENPKALHEERLRDYFTELLDNLKKKTIASCSTSIDLFCKRLESLKK